MDVSTSYVCPGSREKSCQDTSHSWTVLFISIFGTDGDSYSIFKLMVHWEKKGSISHMWLLQAPASCAGGPSKHIKGKTSNIVYSCI